MDIRGLDLFSYIDYRLYLEDIFAARKAQDRKYTFGQWAKELGISSVSGLTMILKGQRHPGPSLTKKLIKNLELTQKEADFFMALIQAKKSSKGDNETFKAIVEKRTQEVEKQDRQVEFKWEMALLREMLKWSDFESLKDISDEQFKYQSSEGYPTIIEQMKNSGIVDIKKSKIYLNESYSPKYKLELSQFIPLHREICELSTDSYYLPKENRLLEHFLINVKREDLPKARQKILDFIESFADEFDQAEGSSKECQIYSVSTLFFPFTN